VAQQRQENDNVMLLDTGDAWVGGTKNGTTTMGDETDGKIVVQAMNLLQTDAMALGEYELGMARDELQARLAEAQFPVLSANAYWEAGRRVVEPYAVLEEAGHKIGVIGLTRLPKSQIPGVDVRDPRGELEGILPEVRRQASSVIVLTDLDFDTAQTTADLDGVDLVVAAMAFPLPDHAVELQPSGALAVVAESPMAGHTGRRVGRLDVTVESDGRLVENSWSSVALEKTLADDPAMDKLLSGAGG
jgi:2',3'-cyclic-nucleotide 2'-phosphodiesterase (5'-nucleotidase family)